MFTGIIEYLGKFDKRTKEGFLFEMPSVLAKQIKEGTSIAINGVCLTVTYKKDAGINVNIMPETLRRTTLGSLEEGQSVNLELPATAQTLLSGHIVQGHTDGAAQLKSMTQNGNSRILKFTTRESLLKYIVPKGSIALDGISLTVIKSERNFFTVGIIPFTWKKTTLHTLKIGDSVNVEADILAKYVEKLIKV